MDSKIVARNDKIVAETVTGAIKSRTNGLVPLFGLIYDNLLFKKTHT